MFNGSMQRILACDTLHKSVIMMTLIEKQAEIKVFAVFSFRSFSTEQKWLTGLKIAAVAP